MSGGIGGKGGGGQSQMSQPQGILSWVLSLLGPYLPGVGLLPGPLTARVHCVPGVVCFFWHLPPLPGSHLPLPVRQH